jgi:hypothetical protein
MTDTLNTPLQTARTPEEIERDKQAASWALKSKQDKVAERRVQLFNSRDSIRLPGIELKQKIQNDPLKQALFDTAVERGLLNPDGTHENERAGIPIAHHRNQYYSANGYLYQRRTFFGVHFTFLMLEESTFHEIVSQRVADMLTLYLRKTLWHRKCVWNISEEQAEFDLHGNDSRLIEFVDGVKGVGNRLGVLHTQYPLIAKGPGLRRRNYMDKAAAQVEAMGEGVGILETVAQDMIKAVQETNATLAEVLKRMDLLRTEFQSLRNVLDGPSASAKFFPGIPVKPLMDNETKI